MRSRAANTLSTFKKRFAHAHQHHVADLAGGVALVVGGKQDLVQDLSGREVAPKAHPAGCAKKYSLPGSLPCWKCRWFLRFE
jgi:hypothetical protein